MIRKVHHSDLCWMLLTENFLVIVKVVFDVAIGEDTVMDGEVLVNGIKFG